MCVDTLLTPIHEFVVSWGESSPPKEGALGFLEIALVKFHCRKNFFAHLVGHFNRGVWRFIEWVTYVAEGLSYLRIFSSFHLTYLLEAISHFNQIFAGFFLRIYLLSDGCDQSDVGLWEWFKIVILPLESTEFTLCLFQEWAKQPAHLWFLIAPYLILSHLFCLLKYSSDTRLPVTDSSFLLKYIWTVKKVGSWKTAVNPLHILFLSERLLICQELEYDLWRA